MGTGTSFQPTPTGQANSDVTYSCSRPARLNAASAKNYRGVDEDALRADVKAWEAEANFLADERERLDASEAMAKKFGGNFGNAFGHDTEGVGSNDAGRRLSFDGMGKKLATQIGTKAVASSGAAVVEQGFAPDPVALGKPAFSLLDILPVQTHPTQLYAYLRQSVRTNNAAVVSDNAVKPTSVYTVVRVEQSLAVIAHLSELIPRYWLVDNPTLEGFVQSELQYGLARAVEAKVISDVNRNLGYPNAGVGHKHPGNAA